MGGEGAPRCCLRPRRCTSVPLVPLAQPVLVVVARGSHGIYAGFTLYLHFIYTLFTRQGNLVTQSVAWRLTAECEMAVNDHHRAHEALLQCKASQPALPLPLPLSEPPPGEPPLL